MKSYLSKYRLFSAFAAFAVAFMSSPILMAAADKAAEEEAPEPVWVLSYASFLGFAGVMIFLTCFFSKRAETALNSEEQKHVAQIRNDKLKQRRKAEQYARVHAQKKK